MCGINGIVSFGSAVNKNTIQRMNDVIKHRGPDGEGIYSNGGCCCLGHVRLSIIDVEGSKQPLSNEDKTLWITFNGEIYNYEELRKGLKLKGHVFETNGDTEVLVHLYEEYGKDMLNQINGMFAFAIWDEQKKELFMARDRLGIKPLYYCIKNDTFIFASEIKAILQHPLVTASPRQESIWHYLTYRSVPSPDTLFKGILQLKPGFSLLVTKDGCHEKKYWDVPLNKCNSFSNGLRADVVTNEVELLLLKSIKRRMISDVPLGSFLSGGIDSSLIVAMMSKLTNSHVNTYSVGFRNFKSSEVSYAKIVADHYKTNHHELILEEDVFADNLDKMTWMRDGPLSEPADIPLHLLAKMASQDVKVLLSGEGSDELFAGYPKYAYDRFAPMFSWMPKSFIQKLSSFLPAKFRRVEVALRSLCENDSAERWAQWFAPFTKDEKIQLFGNGSMCGSPSKDYSLLAQDCNNLDAMLYTDCKLWLPENLLARGDRMTMAASVECRVPFLDHELVEYAFTLPSDAKIKYFSRKWQIKQVARKYLPETIINRPKVGFSVPLSQWFRGKLKDMCYDRICNRDGITREVFDQKALSRILDDHCSCRKDNSLKIWTLLGLAIWDEAFCNNIMNKSVTRTRQTK